MHGANSFPTIKLLRGGASVAYDGTAERSLDALRTWALDLLPSAQITPLSARRPDTLDAFIAGPCAKARARAAAAAAAAGADGGADAAADADAGGCFVVCHKDGEATPAWLKALSFGVRATAAFAEARGAGADAVAARLLAGDGALPAVIALCGGDPARALRAPGLPAAPGAPLSRPAVETFIEHVLHGRACSVVVAREKPVLDLSTDYSRQRIAALRALLASRADACAGCVEKSDFVAAVLRHAAAEAAAAAGGGGESGAAAEGVGGGAEAHQAQAHAPPHGADGEL
jgi:hypothetical protein